ncbi:hypothetical protein [Intrasporangium sp.]|uniref:hypothetical protein n=1 Tax=Intrasporangium sp. TaxID=1925024 RepID=UPI0032221E82
MVRSGIVAGLSAGLFCLGGCGVATQAPGSTTTPVAPVDAATTRPGTSRVAGAPGLEVPPVVLTGPVFPLTLRRTGGTAGFHDTVVLRGDGTLTVDTDTIHGRTCRLDRATRTALLVALSTLQLGSPHTTPAGLPERTPTSSDPITLTVTDVHHRPVDIDDPSLGEIHSRIAALVSDVTLTVPALTRCTPGHPPR